MKRKIRELSGAALDYAVALAEGRNVQHYHTWLETVNEFWRGKDCSFAPLNEFRIMEPDNGTASLRLPTCEEVADDIIDREGISTVRLNDLYFPEGNEKGEHWEAYHCASVGASAKVYGTSRREAAMRAWAIHKLGLEIDIPEELCS